MELITLAVWSLICALYGREAVSLAQPQDSKQRECIEVTSANAIRTRLADAQKGSSIQLCIADSAPECDSRPCCL